MFEEILSRIGKIFQRHGLPHMIIVHLGAGQYSSNQSGLCPEIISAAETISDIPKKYGKPLIATSTRGSMKGVAFDRMKDRGIPFFEFPEEAARAMYGLYRYSRVNR